MDKDIRQRFQQAEGALLDSMSGGVDSLVSFESSLSSLYADLSRGIVTGQLSDDTISLANSVGARVGIITRCFLDLHKTQEESRTQFLDGVGSILESFGHVTISPPSLPTAQNTHSQESSLPPFIEPAYKWLLGNIHNPYPSSDTKENIAKSSGSSMNSVSAWFISARRRIGWTTICRKYFKNRRADTLDAAYRALVKEDPSIALPQTVFHDFIQMRATAQDLYASTFTKSALAGDLDVVVKDMTEEDRLQLEQEKKEHAQEEKKRRKEEKEIRRKQRALERQAQMALTAFTSYPSPSHSRSPSPVPTLEESWTDESEDEEGDINPPVLAGRKRRASSELTDSRQSPCMERLMKRLRSSAKLPGALVETPALPSPSSTTEGLDSNDEIEIVAPPCPSGSSRKRRLSDGDSHCVPKRPRGVLTGPRVHTVSDPLPRPESGIDDWFQTNFFEVPPPVENVGFDQSTPLDIEVFSGYTFSDTQENSMPTLADVPLFGQQVADLEVPSYNSFPTPLLGDLGQFLDALSAFAPDNSCTAPSAINTISQPSINLADPLSSGPCSWADLLNSDQSFLPTVDQFPQSSSCGDLSQILPEIDFSALHLPMLSPPPQPEISSPVDDARLAKLEQLQLLREQARLLEQDLAVSV
ncbi:mating-type homeodomain transcription factor A1 [Rhizopogon vesiculosus]|uniref:Mating-type homeodomain transcription factor A1 n=1 Tax=Rhizopogon vesiculosus TaxID=180088 RepID=A0A1J8QF24_9AGAM|nr:mating-type homeodomain transcription factor A1 [Rhizopogon vesiculosus]